MPTHSTESTDPDPVCTATAKVVGGSYHLRNEWKGKPAMAYRDAATEVCAAYLGVVPWTNLQRDINRFVADNPPPLRHRDPWVQMLAYRLMGMMQ